MPDDENNVIHVRFGPEGGRVLPQEAAPEARPPTVRTRGASPDPLQDLYTTGEVARLFHLSAGRLRYWDSSGFLSPSGRAAGRRRAYTFQDLIGIRVAKSLLDSGMPLQKVRKAVDALRTSLPKVTRPLSELRVSTDGQSLLVRDERAAFEPTTGQLALDFEVSALRDDVVRALRPERTSDNFRRRAYELYLEGCRYDEDEATYDDAEAAYREALELDPQLGNALTNLGNLRFRRGDVEEAQRLYVAALKVDATQPEAYYNLGFLLFEAGDPAGAADHFVRALEHDSAFADAHFNLAMALEELGQPGAARPHWETYLQLDPSGPWADVARRHLADPS